MKASVLAALALLFAVCLTLPIEELEERATPSNGPVTVLEASLKNYDCGGIQYAWKDVYEAIAWGTKLEDIGETRGKGVYPHQFNNYGGEVALPARCKEGDPNMKEYPMKKGGRYDGGKNNKNDGDERAVYLHYKGENTGPTAYDPQSTFCGVMTHKGAAKGKFVLCTEK